MLDVPSKTVTRAMRPQLLKGLEAATLSGTVGTRVGVSMGLPAMTVQAYLAHLKTQRLNGGILASQGKHEPETLNPKP